MPTHNVNLTEHFDEFIENGVASGRFSNASEMVSSMAAPRTIIVPRLR